MKPFPHQQEIFDQTKDTEYYALLWEMRVGKTLPMIMTGVYLHEKGLIDAMLILAPSGVHLNWSRKSIVEAVEDPYVFEWVTGKSSQVGYRRSFDKFIDTSKDKRLRFFCVNLEALASKKTLSILYNFATLLRCMLVADESDNFQNPKAKRTRSVFKIAVLCLFRRILTGTPATQGPFGLWAQFKILSVDILGRLYVPFKQRYGIFRRVQFGRSRSFEELVEYRDLDQLYQRIAPHSSRKTRKDVFGTEDPIYEQRYFMMNKEEERVFGSMKSELIAQLDSGMIITAQQDIVCLLRLHQISRGFVSDGPTIHRINDSEMPSAAKMLLDTVKQIEGKIIIWCKFKEDVNIVLETMAKAKYEFVRYDGTVPVDERPATLDKLRDDKDVKGLVGTRSAGGVGVDMSSAETTIGYSHTYNLGEYEQANARMQGPNQKSTALYVIDLIAADSPDERLMHLLQNKKDLAAIVTGDSLREMLA